MESKLLEQIKKLLEINGTTVYDEKIQFYYPAAISKIKAEGVIERSTESSDYNLFLSCICFQLRLLLNLGESNDSLKKDYATFVEILRSTNVKT